MSPQFRHLTLKSNNPAHDKPVNAGQTKHILLPKKLPTTETTDTTLTHTQQIKTTTQTHTQQTTNTTQTHTQQTTNTTQTHTQQTTNSRVTRTKLPTASKRRSPAFSHWSVCVPDNPAHQICSVATLLLLRWSMRTGETNARAWQMTCHLHSNCDLRDKSLGLWVSA